MIRLQRNSDGTPKTNRSTHTADLTCDACGIIASGVDMNANASYTLSSGVHTGISISCSAIGGSCSSTTCWPLSDGTMDAVELALVKTA